MEFREKLRKLRGERGLSTTELSKLSGVSQSYISDIENGRGKSPTKDVIEKLSKALRVSPLYFFDEDVYTPLDLLPNAPEEVRDFILTEQNIPYLKISQKAKDEGITPEMLEGLLDTLIAAMSTRNK